MEITEEKNNNKRKNEKEKRKKIKKERDFPRPVEKGLEPQDCCHHRLQGVTGRMRGELHS